MFVEHLPNVKGVDQKFANGFRYLLGQNIEEFEADCESNFHVNQAKQLKEGNIEAVIKAYQEKQFTIEALVLCKAFDKKELFKECLT